MPSSQKIHALLAFLFHGCNVYLCLKPKSRQSPIEKLRTVSFSYLLYNQPAYIRIPLKILAFILWPINSIRFAFRNYSYFGKSVKQEYGTGTWQQFAQMLMLAWFEFIHPRYYYQFHLFDKMRSQKRGAYLFQRKSYFLFMALNGFTSVELIVNKDKFADFCLEHGFPVPKTLVHFENGNMTLNVAPDCWQDKDIVVKPVKGHAGRDIKFGYAEGNGNYRYREKIIPIDKLLQQIALNSRKESFLIQERLNNHPELCALSNEYLASIRIVTFLGQDNAPAFLGAYLSLPYDAITVSNEGRVFPLDLTTGKILSPPLAPLMPEWKQELVEASRLAVGNILPYWQEAKALVREGHRLLPDYFSLGWDVAITENGPVILETNTGWDTDAIQHFHDLPLGDSEFCRCAMGRVHCLTN